jgi:hypothetical protein
MVPRRQGPSGGGRGCRPIGWSRSRVSAFLPRNEMKVTPPPAPAAVVVVVVAVAHGSILRTTTAADHDGRHDGKVVEPMGDTMDRALQFGGGNMATKRGGQAEAASERRHNPTFEKERKSTANIVVKQSTVIEIEGRRGVKRKTTHRSGLLDVCCHKKQNGNRSVDVAEVSYLQ